MPNDELQTLWQGQPVAPVPIDPEQLRRKSARLYGRVRARNLRETVAGAVAIALLAWVARAETGLPLVSSLMLMAGMLYVIWHLWWHGKASELPVDLGAMDAISFHRRELTRQRDLLRGVFWWYLAPFLPGLVLTAVVAVRRSWVAPAILIVFVAAANWFVIWINRRAVDCLDRQLAELSAEREER
jgi:hypothetical protein